MLEVLRRRADRMGERGFALSERQLRRWLAGDVASLHGARPANVRVAEAEFGWPIDVLLSDEASLTRRSSMAWRNADTRQLRTRDFVTWVAAHSPIGYEDAYLAVTSRIDEDSATPAWHRAADDEERVRVSRASIADWVSTYYGAADFYRARVGRFELNLSVVAQPSWTGLGAELGGSAETCWLERELPAPEIRLNEAQAHAALARLAFAEAVGTVLVNDPTYGLCLVDVGVDHVRAGFSCVDFADYAMTSDLLENELRALLTSQTTGAGESVPLRDAWLPSVEVALRLGDRVCAGGPVCLVAIADGEQYQLLVQERSRRVVNATGTLAVIPKAFHQPIVDPFGEVRISTTLEREFEEELLGRPDLEQQSDEYGHRAAPLHPARSSPPLAWLRAHPDSWQMECTAFGINMVTGTHEFACLVMVHDPAWWNTYGHLLEANWEARRLRRYSSLDGAGIEQLVSEPSWSNEGLFAFVEGLRRLKELGAPHVRVPIIERTQ
jgi:hypothetical protein